jgi:hypothetical protein
MGCQSRENGEIPRVPGLDLENIPPNFKRRRK